MAVFTAAAAAIAAAVASTAVATVATAVVTTSIAVGVAGLAVTAIGAVTKNEGLLKAGKIMGYVGTAGGLVGGAIGGFGSMAAGGGFLEGASNAYSSAAGEISKAWDAGVGSWFSGGEAVAAPTGAAPSSVPGAADGVQNTVNPATGIGNDFPSTSIEGWTPNPAAGTSGGMSAPTSPTDMSTAAASPFDAAPAAPSVSAVSAPPAPITTPPTAPLPATVDATNTINQAGQVGAGTVLAPSGANPAATPGLFDKIPDWVKFSAMTTGAQGVTGALAGWYQGASAEQRLEFDKLQNQQRQNQIDYLNRNNQYAPLLQFRRS